MGLATTRQQTCLRIIRLGFVCALAVSVAACAGAGVAVVGAGTGVAMGTTVDYTLSGVAYKTFTAPLDEVRTATRRSLKNMGMAVTKDEKNDKGWRFEASANERVITVELQQLTAKTTRVRVVADDGVFFKDKATESEIIYQTADALDHPVQKNKIKPVASVTSK